MKYSYQWLAQHIDAPLPGVDSLVRTITEKAFEVENVESVTGGDTLLEMKVLPDRAHDALSHRGMGYEVAALFALPKKKTTIQSFTVDKVLPPQIVVEDSALCPRYIAVRIENIVMRSSEKKISDLLELVGQRSINMIVDLTNFIMFDIGQPMHAFDADKIRGKMSIRLAKKGEHMTTLDGKVLEFDGGEQVIADEEGILALAGIKGGKKAEVDTQTTSIILECANFNPTITRRTSTKHNIKTDASKRFENGISSELSGEAVHHALHMLKKMTPDIRVSEIVDCHQGDKEMIPTISINAFQINHLLGTRMTDDDVENILKKNLDWDYLKENDGGSIKFTVTPPSIRQDIRILEDLIEEIGRHFGYSTISASLPPLLRQGLPHKRLYYGNQIRSFLARESFSEVYTYSFAKEVAPITVLNPVGKDRPYMRHSLTTGIKDALEKNKYYSPLVGIDDVCIFELGNVFTNEGERMNITIGMFVVNKKKSKNLEGYLKEILNKLREETQINLEWKFTSEGQMVIAEANFDMAIVGLSSPTSFHSFEVLDKSVAYRSLSVYPFVVRDVALWVPRDAPVDEIIKIILENGGKLIVRLSLFDRFEKDEKVSYAFRVVFQSFEKTLEDEEINIRTSEIVQALEEHNKGWEVRK